MPREVSFHQTADLYREAFDHVCDPQDWKAPIDALVPRTLVNLYAQAVEFMTGTAPTVELASGTELVRIRAAGYRSGPCGG